MLTGVALERHRRKSRQDIFHLRAQELRRGAQRVPVLPQLANVGRDMLLLFGRDSKLRTLEQVSDRLRNFHLTGMWARDGVNEWREGATSAEHRFGAHRSAYGAEECEVDSLVGREGAHGR